MYPNDQPISRSADLLCKELEHLRAHGVRRVKLIAHSMGGLVSREMLTSPRLYAGRGSEHAARPDVTRLIMVATPNHGSEIVRLRFLAELRDQFERAMAGDGGLFVGIFDGAGEAKVDLLPGSEFLVSLNARKLPTDVLFTIVAGRSSPITKETVNQLRSVVELARPEALRGKLNKLVGELSQFTDGGSDGLVTVDSTRLVGVEDHVIVDGNHLTIIRNMTKTSQRIPPAIPHVLNRLEREGSVHDASK
jgi:pimeloyl-ACP methyl ester carboxylesterase